MKLFTKTQERVLRANYRMNRNLQGVNKDPLDYRPVIKLFNPCGPGTWLFTELDDDNIFFGLCDLGHGFAELGYQALTEMEVFRHPTFKLGIERDLYFTPTKTLSEYAKDAEANQGIAA